MVCYLDIIGTPSGAEVRINGVFIGTTPIDDYKIYPGYYNIDIRKTGYIGKTYLNYEIKTTDLAKTLEYTLTPEPTMPTWRNSIQWESYYSGGGTWYLHTLYGKKVSGGFNFFVSKSVAYLNHPAGTYNKNIDIKIPDGTPSGTYDAWTVISTTNDPSQIKGINIIAEKINLNAITVP